MDDIQVIENIIGLEQQDILVNLVEDPYFPLFLRTSTITDKDEYSEYHWKDAKTQEGINFSHMFLKDGGEKSAHSEKIDPLIGSFLFNSRINMLPYRARLNITMPSPSYDEAKHFTPHIDTQYKDGITAIYYVNDADGDTLFFKTPKERAQVNDLEVIKRISPKKGSMVYFNSQTIHAGKPPINAPYRVVINFNFAP